MEGDCVDILMATYNGELYVKEQIDSIISQTCSNWRLFIRDDGSTDNTLTILENYCEVDNRIILVKDLKGGLGISGNFRELLRFSSSSYIMFVDQDDVWFENKMEESLKNITSAEGADKCPVLFFCNSILMNSDMSKKIGMNYSSNYRVELRNFLFYNAGFQGTAMTFNRALYSLIEPFFDNCKVHDYHVSLVGLLLADVCYLNTPLLYYRRHSSAATNVNKTIFKRLVFLFKRKNVLFDKQLVCYLMKFVEDRGNMISLDKLNVIRAYHDIYFSDSKIDRVLKAFKGKFKLRNSRLYLLFKILIVR